MQSLHYIFSLFTNPDHVSMLLSNLEEADIATKNVSIVATETKIVDQLSSHTGPFSGTPEILDTTTATIDLSKDDKDYYVQKVKEGNILVIIPTNDTLVQTITEMTKDNGASENKVINKYPNNLINK